MSSFVHLHVHSHYSVLDGMSTIPGLVDKAIQCNMPAIALTDHGNMFGIKEFYNYVKKINGKTKDKISELEKKLADKQLAENDINNYLDELERLKNKKPFKAIIGCEAYVARRGHKSKETQEDRSGYHLVLLAKNKTGYKNLCKLISIGYIDGLYYRPRIDHELLEKYSEGLIVASACLGGEIHKKIEAGDIAGAEEAVLWHKRVFGDDYYIELQRHKTDKPNADYSTYEKQRVQNEELIKLARKTNTKIIASNDVHFVEEEHAEAHERLICLSTGKDLDDPDRMRYTKQEWLKTTEEMASVFPDLPEALENTFEIAEKVEIFSIDSGPIMPRFDIPLEFGTEEEYRQRYTEKDLFDEFTRDEKGNVVLSEEEANKKINVLGGYDKLYRIKLEADYLQKISLEGATKRYGENFSDEIMERIQFELHTMKTMGFPGYFLIVQDFINAARSMGVSVGPGRGSAAGSVVAYCLRITDIDPLKYDLLFERFLNPDRISMPDIDIDFDDDGRALVLRWVTDKYGKERVAHIITYGTMATKSSIKDVARVQKLPLSEAERLTKLVPGKFAEDATGKSPKVNISNCIKYVPELQSARYSNDENLANTLKYAEMLEGTVRQVGVHACGVIIGADDLTNFVPLSTAAEKGTKEDMLVTQYEGSVIEDVGLIKMDFLGLKTLSIIKDALENIKKSRGVDIDIDNIPLDDQKTYELFSNGQTVGTFQFESAGMQKYLRELQPTQFEDLIAMNALYRPGPMQYIPQFIARKHGREKIEYPFPEMETRLKDTYGITVYQEQVMLLSRDLAGFTRGQSDELRKAMGKKLVDKMEALKVKFLDGAEKKGFGPKSKLEQIWSDWAEFAKYAFNKSHATCYSWIAYQTAYLKAHYPAEFMAANLTRSKDDITEVGKFMDECKNMGIKVLGPDVNESDLNFTVNSEGNIRFGLGGVKGVGEGAVIAISNERKQNGKYKSMFDFIERVNLTACNKKTIESLALAGGFDEFPDVKREQLFVENSKGEQVLETVIRYGNKFQSDKALNTNSLFGDFEVIEISKPELPYAPEWSVLEKLNKERDLIGMYLSSHPLDEFEFEMKYLCNTSTTELKDLEQIKGRPIKVGGLITDIRHGMSKAGNPYGVFIVEDYGGSQEFPLFGKNYIEFGKYMIKDLYVFISAIVQEKGADYRFKKVNPDPNVPKELELKILQIDELREIKHKLLKSMTLTVSLQQLTDPFAEKLAESVKLNKGNTNLYVEVVDENSTDKILLFARQYRFDMNKEFYNMIKQAKHDGIILNVEVKD
ncbi:DNA polymerase III subunit alpha [Paludibacter sp. 221]|uniref:DNA polymerase III subunit alpha n=1 Tax=Paludibacter sp. 221 TaxID=2302939 RepID=UPI0013D1533E|nr:DNA polymerase III subunit alpha [Paludibacter sp. 221]NDV47676.1 DNA polymerase III subunit alpha [Paludibacter sp. 221]